jgi:hypothetical protein
MHLDRYAFTTEPTHHNYEFTGKGRRGSIKKVVVFELIDPDLEIYNLAFGDYAERTKTLNDLSVSDNKDKDKMLATVAATVFDFSEQHPTATIVARGSTPERTRLYRMGITKHFKNISAVFDVEGYDRGWVQFQAGKDFKAFSVKRKNA